MEARRNALRAQRDKILSRKRKERELQLQKQEQVERLATEKGKYQKLEFKNELFFFNVNQFLFLQDLVDNVHVADAQLERR